MSPYRSKRTLRIEALAECFPERSRRLLQTLHDRILVLDGAMGTQIQAYDPATEDWGGEPFANCSENILRTHPEWIGAIHESFLEAGSDIIETNTFGATPLVLAEFGLESRARELNLTACRLARAAAEKHATPERPRFVAGAVGPTTKQLSLTPGGSLDRQAENYREQITALIEGEVDALLFETVFDTLNLKAAFCAADRAFEETGVTLPIMVSVTIDPSLGGLKMLGGQDIEAVYTAVMQRPILSFGMNCAVGPDALLGPLRTLSRICESYTSLYPNAGLPDEQMRYRLGPDAFTAKLEAFAAEGWLNLVGGCCGTTPEHIRKLAAMAKAFPPRRPSALRRTVVSGMEALEINEEVRPLFVGERTNSLGSRQFKRLIGAERYEEAAEIGRRQVRGGAHILDVCLQNPDRDELADMSRFLEVLTRIVHVPLMIDSTDTRVFEAALKRIQGKVIYNSINLEDGEARFREIVPLAKQYGAALIVGCIDEDRQHGMGITRRRKLEIAERSHELLTRKYGVAGEDLIFDPLVFPAGTGDAQYAGSARETIEGVRLIKRRFPNSKTALGISNVSFGLPAAGREVLNSVFLHLCVEAGLDLPIVNTQKLEPYSRISEADKKVCLDLIDNLGGDPIAAFAAHFRERKVRKPSAGERAKKPIDERLAHNVVEGSKEGLLEDLNELLKTRPALEIINGPLMAGMDEVGRLFNANEMIVAEVLQSAEVMKAAVTHLEPHLEKASAARRGKVLLATVKGDVHDIGKSLVEIIFSNNGYEVLDLGIKVPPSEIIQACREQRPSLIGLSGLLVKSAQQMVLSAEDFRRAGLNVPLLVGGAALSDRFTRTRIAPAYGGGAVFYAKDAMNGLDLANRIRDPKACAALFAERQQAAEAARAAAPATPRPSTPAAPAAPAKRAALKHDFPAPVPPDLKLHVLDSINLDELFPWINPLMLYGKHLGLKGNPERQFQQGVPKALELKKRVAALWDEIVRERLFRPRAVYRFFPASPDGDALLLHNGAAPDPGGASAGSAGAAAVAARFLFPRQRGGRGWCLSDFVRPRGSGGESDYAALFAVTCGEGIRERAEAFKRAGRLRDCITLQAIAVECAEGLSEWLHAQLRAAWGFPDPAEMKMPRRFQARYRGLRVSFGYPACPRLEDQRLLFEALEVEKHIGVRLTEEYMMDPEASVSALVFHHPEARYFGINEADLRRFEEEHFGANAPQA